MTAATTHLGRIGPNAIIQTIAALRERYPAEQLPGLLLGGGEGYLSALPSAMIAEEEFHALVTLLAGRLSDEQLGQILYRAGERTADYVQANRIPAPIRALLKLLPGPASLRLLLPAISQHAWTFAGSGAFRFSLGLRPFVSIGRPVGADTGAIAGALCRYYYGAFGKMLRDLVSPRLVLRETACQAAGDQACVYQIVI